MGKIFKGQTALEIILDTQLETSDMASVSESRIYYKKPSGVSGYWAASIVEGTSKIKYLVPTSETIDEIGAWSFWSWVKLPIGEARGEAVKEIIYDSTK
jgi:hypothetical protein